jgi:hypothetical protein
MRNTFLLNNIQKAQKNKNKKEQNFIFILLNNDYIISSCKDLIDFEIYFICSKDGKNVIRK